MRVGRPLAGKPLGLSASFVRSAMPSFSKVRYPLELRKALFEAEKNRFVSRVQTPFALSDLTVL